MACRTRPTITGFTTAAAFGGSDLERRGRSGVLFPA